MYDLGDIVPLTVTVRDAAGVATNATTVTLSIQLPDGTTATPTVPTPPAVTGVYTYDYAPTMLGQHRYTFTSTGPTTQYGPALFDVASTSRGLVSLQDLKALPSMRITGSTWDDTLRLFIEAATDIVERHTGQAVVRRAVSESVEATSAGLWLTHRPVLSLTTLADSDGVVVSVAGLVLDTALGLVRRPTYSTWRGRYTAGYVAGMTTIPANYSLAARIIVEHLWQTQRGTMTPTATPGGLDDSDPVGMGFAIPRRAVELLGPPRPLVA